MPRKVAQPGVGLQGRSQELPAEKKSTDAAACIAVRFL